MSDGIASPNPDFPQPIKNVTGNANVKIQNKNMFDDEIEYGSISPNGQPLPTQSCIRSKNFIEVKPETNYNLQNNSGYKGFIYLYDEDKNYLNYFTITSSSFNFTTISSTKYIKFRSLSNENNLSTKYQLEQGTTATSYVPHQEQNYPFTFAEGQRGMQGTKLLDDGIHQMRKQRVLNGTETGWMQNSYATKENTLGFYILLNNIALKNTGELGYLCDKFMALPASNWSADIQGVVQMNDKTLLFKINKSSLITEDVNGFKTWLSSNNITVEYTLEQPEIIPYNSTQQAQYNAIKEARSYDDITNISSESDELGFKMDVESLSNGVSSSNTRTLALGSLNQGSLNNIKEVDTEEAQDKAQDEAQVVESEE